MPDHQPGEGAGRGTVRAAPAEDAGPPPWPVLGDDPPSARRRAWYARFGRWCAQPRSAMILAAVLAGLTIVGSLFPQMPIGLTDALQARWIEAVAERYGGATAWQALGVLSFARSPLYLGTTALLVVATLICLTRRCRSLWTAFRDTSIIHDAGRAARGKSYRLHASVDRDRAIEALARSLRQARYRVRIRDEGARRHLRADRYRWARLGTLATHLAVPLAVGGMLASSILATRFEMALPPGQVAPAGPAIDLMLRNDGLELEDAGGALASYAAQITLVEDGAAIGSHTLRVNRPLNVLGHQVFLDSYWEAPEGYGIVLIVARDPGYVPFVIGGLLFALGTILALWFCPSTLWMSMEASSATARIWSGRHTMRRQAEEMVRSAGLELDHDTGLSAEGRDP